MITKQTLNKGGQEMKKNLVRIVSICIIMFFLFGCATHPDKINATYVSPLQYQGYSCKQIQQELIRVNGKISEITGQQDKKANKDAIAFGIGMILFWPALFFMIGGDKKEELAKLKGEYEALENIAIQKKCDISAELEKVKNQREQNREAHNDNTNR